MVGSFGKVSPQAYYDVIVILYTWRYKRTRTKNSKSHCLETQNCENRENKIEKKWPAWWVDGGRWWSQVWQVWQV